MRRTVLVSILMACLSVFFLCINTQASQNINDIRKKKNELNNKIIEEKNKIKSYESSKEELEKQIKSIDKKSEQIGDKLESLNNKIEKIKGNIKEKNVSIKSNREKKQRLYKELKKKIKFIYENGNKGELQILLEAETMSDILNKQEYINEIYSFDSEKLEELKKLIKNIKSEKNELKEKESELKQTKDDYNLQQDDLEQLISKKQKEITSFENKIKTADLKTAEYKADVEEQDRVIVEIEKAIALKKKREAELRKKAELKRQREQKEKEEKNNRRDKKGSHKHTGKFIWPCPSYTRISSGFGYRKHPTLKVRKMHNGLDMAASTGAAIVAAKSGEVARAGYNSTMGNYVILNHGDSLLTIYMHCSKLKVKTGQGVQGGQVIATVGSTGRSTGSHLHFGVQYNGKYVNPWDYLR